MTFSPEAEIVLADPERQAFIAASTAALATETSQLVG